MNFKNLVLVTALSLFSVVSYGQQTGHQSSQQDRQRFITQSFASINRASKGALGPNVYQTTNGRVNVSQNGQIINPPGGNLITAAFRSDAAEALAQKDFYLGNRFSTNYFSLHHKFLSTPAERQALAFRIDHSRFMNSPQILTDAQSMARHMILEKFYMTKFPNARITTGNLFRGSADADHEKKFYGYITDYLAKFSQNEVDYLALYELQRRHDLVGDANGVSLQSLRDEVARIFSTMESQGDRQPHVAAFRLIRNNIHNYMTPDVVSMLQTYLRAHSNRLGPQTLQRVRNLLSRVQSYYAVNKQNLVGQLSLLQNAELAAEAKGILDALQAKGNSSASLEHLGRFTTKVKEGFASSKKPNSIHWIMRASAFLQSELASRPLETEFASRARVSLDSVYAAGLITRPTWVRVHQLLAGEPHLAGPQDLRALNSALESVFVEAHGLAERSLQPALADWKLVESSMETVLDDILRASLLSELSQISVKIKSQLPAVSDIYSIENEGVAFGYLVYVPQGTTSAQVALLERTMIPIFAELPLDLSVVAAIITEQPQTPLSHVSIKSKARGTPNLYYKNASQDPLFKDFAARRALVRVSFLNGRVEIREANLNEAQAAWAAGSPAQGSVQIQSNLEEKRIRSIKEMNSRDVVSVGAKAANYAEAARAVPEGVFQNAFGLPFFYYKEFIEGNSFDGRISIAQKIREVVQDPRSKTDRAFLVASLEAIQARIKSDETQVSPALISELTSVLNQAYPGTRMRFRSSTNSEDLPNFSGAGLYDSYTYRPGHAKRTIAFALKTVWASVMNVRAYDEREHFGIPHLDVYMGILISPSFPDETANGVAVTRNLVRPELGAGVYINTQVGEEAVTNPNPNLTPEELLVQVPAMKLNYLKASSLSPLAPIMTDSEATTFAQYFMMIHNHFKKIVDPQNQNPDFAMDMEFKIDTRNGQRLLFIKQARPYVTN